MAGAEMFVGDSVAQIPIANTCLSFSSKEFLMRQLQLMAFGEPSHVIQLNTLAEPALGPE
jgi:hypothetical protein